MRLIIGVLICLVLLTGCSTDAPLSTAVNGHTVVQTTERFLWVPIYTREKEVKTKDQEIDDLEVETERRKRDTKLLTTERQSTAAFWAGVGLLAFAALCAVLGYVLQGWKFWGGLAVVGAGLGAAFWSFEHLVPYLKWPAFGIGGVVVIWTMWKFKDFSIIDKLKQSKPGKLL